MLNQLRTLAKRGFASNLSLSAQENKLQKPFTTMNMNSIPTSNPDSTTVTGSPRVSSPSILSSPSPITDCAQSTAKEDFHGTQDVDEIAQNRKCYLRSVLGRLDLVKDGVEDPEALYLGRWDADTKV